MKKKKQREKRPRRRIHVLQFEISEKPFRQIERLRRKILDKRGRHIERGVLFNLGIGLLEAHVHQVRQGRVVASIVKASLAKSVRGVLELKMPNGYKIVTAAR